MISSPGVDAQIEIVIVLDDDRLGYLNEPESELEVHKMLVLFSSVARNITLRQRHPALSCSRIYRRFSDE